MSLNGKLGLPEFSFGDAIWAGIKNALVNSVTGPFRAIGKLFSRGEEPEALEVDPVEFSPGSAAMTARRAVTSSGWRTSCARRPTSG